MVTKRDLAWKTALVFALEVGDDGIFTPDMVQEAIEEQHGDESPSLRMTRDTLKSMWSMGVLRRRGGGGRTRAEYHLNPDLI